LNIGVKYSMELRLSEELFVLALDEKRGTFARFKGEYFKYGVAAALLQELLILQKLKLDEDIVILLEANSFGDKLLDPVLEILEQSVKNRKVQHWVSKIGGKFGKLKKILLDDLINKGVIRPKEEPGGQEEKPGLFHRQRFRTWNDIPLQRLRKSLNNILVYGGEPDPASLRLIGLIHACKLTRRVFAGKEDQEQVMQRIEELTDGDVFKKAVRSVVNTNRVSAVSGIFSAAAVIFKEAC
jgi:Golgi phosphoprotein 3